MVPRGTMATSLHDQEGFLGQIESLDNWGYVIYRTVYTPESDSQWETAIQRLDAYTRFDFFQTPSPDEERQRVCDAIAAKYHNTIFQDQEAFDAASPDDLREHFLNWLAQQGRSTGSYGPNNRMFLMIDEESLQSILNAPEDPYISDLVPSLDWPKHRVKVIDATHKPNPELATPAAAAGTGGGRGRGPRGRPGRGMAPFKGWVYVSLYRLWYLWHRTMHEPDLRG